MEGITNEIRNKIKCAVKAKLQEIGAYVDEELPDYIMVCKICSLITCLSTSCQYTRTQDCNTIFCIYQVMIANRRSKSQMTSELSLFLGSHTDKFTDWLHLVLEKLEAFVVGNSSDKSKETLSDTPKSGSETFVLPVKSQNPITTAVHPTSGLLAEKKMEAHTNTPNHKTVTNLEKDQYVPMPVVFTLPPSTNVHQSPEVDMEDDCLNIREDVEQEFHGEDRGVKKNTSSSANYQVSALLHLLNFPMSKQTSL